MGIANTESSSGLNQANSATASAFATPPPELLRYASSVIRNRVTVWRTTQSRPRCTTTASASDSAGRLIIPSVDRICRSFSFTAPAEIPSSTLVEQPHSG